MSLDEVVRILLNWVKGQRHLGARDDVRQTGTVINPTHKTEITLTDECEKGHTRSRVDGVIRRGIGQVRLERARAEQKLKEPKRLTKHLVARKMRKNNIRN